MNNLKYILITLLVTISSLSHAQKLEIEMGAGGFISHTDYNHDLFYENGVKGWENYGSTLFLGFTRQVKNNWYFSSELGFQNSTSLVSVNFDRKNFNSDTTRLSINNNLNLKRAFLGIMGEYRITKGKFIGQFKGGFLMSADLSNTFINNNESIESQSYPFAIKLSSGVIRNFKGFGLRLSLDYVGYAQSNLIDRNYPSIKFRQYHYNISFVYNLDATTTTN